MNSYNIKCIPWSVFTYRQLPENIHFQDGDLYVSNYHIFPL